MCGGTGRRSDADVDYTFAQIPLRTSGVDYSGNCGNMASAIGPFAVEEGLVETVDGLVTVRIHNTNTSKTIHAQFEVRGGRPVEHGPLVIPGVAGSGAPVRLDFLAPGGATTGQVLPTGAATDVLNTSRGPVTVSLIDAANACAFVPAAAIGARGDELPAELESRGALLEFLAEIRELASMSMGIAGDRRQARDRILVPLVAMVATPSPFTTLDGATVPARDFDVNVRTLSSGQPHRAIPMTGALCVAVAARIPGSVVAGAARATNRPLRVGMPSGVLTVDADVHRTGDVVAARTGTLYRTTRRLFSGLLSVS